MKNYLYTSIALFLFVFIFTNEVQCKPFALPPFSNEKISIHAEIPGLKKAPDFPYDEIYQAIIDCYPEKSTFEDLEIKLQTGAKFFERSSGLSLDDPNGIGGKFYASITADYPLYSHTEISRKREREYQRREKTATLVAKLSEYVHEKNLSIRLRDINILAEARSRIRVREGLAPLDENIKYLNEVAKHESALNTAKSNIQAARLALIGQCSDENKYIVTSYIDGILNHSQEDKQ